MTQHQLGESRLRYKSKYEEGVRELNATDELAISPEERWTLIVLFVQIHKIESNWFSEKVVAFTCVSPWLTHVDVGGQVGMEGIIN